MCAWTTTLPVNPYMVCMKGHVNVGVLLSSASGVLLVLGAMALSVVLLVDLGLSKESTMEVCCHRCVAVMCGSWRYKRRAVKTPCGVLLDCGVGPMTRLLDLGEEIRWTQLNLGCL